MIEKRQISDNKVYFCLSLIFFVIIQMVLVEHLPLSPDEFFGLNLASKLKNFLPYQEMGVTKAPLGHYFWLPALVGSLEHWDRILMVKIYLASVGTLILSFVVVQFGLLFKLRSYWPIYLSLLMTPTFIGHFADLRTDMLCSLLGYFSLALFLRNQFYLSGLVLGLSVLSLQKSIFLLPAFLFFVVYRRLTRLCSNRSILTFVLGGVSLLLAYLMIGFIWLSPEILIKGFFAPLTDQVYSQHTFKSPYEIRTYWWLLFKQTPILSTFVLIGIFLSLKDRRRSNEISLGGFSLILLISCFLHNQPWPYFFIFVFPVALITAPRACDYFLEKFGTSNDKKKIVWSALLLGLIFWPLYKCQVFFRVDSKNQKRTIKFLEQNLDLEDYYLAGAPLVIKHNFSTFDLSRGPDIVHNLYGLDAVHLRSLHHLRIDEIEMHQSHLEREMPKFFVLDYRTQQLPPKITKYLQENFVHYGGNIYLNKKYVTEKSSFIDHQKLRGQKPQSMYPIRFYPY